MVKVILNGESLFSSRNFRNRLDEKIINLFQNSDGTFSNAEFTTPEKSTSPAAGRGYVTAVRPETLKEFVDLKINLLAFANNHTGDFGTQGMLDTLNATQRFGLMAAGIGYSLDEVRRPKFLDTKNGRIGLVAAGSTRSNLFVASNAGNGIAARPGVNPLRWETKYEVPKKDFDFLNKLYSDLKLRDSYETGNEVERWKSLPDDEIKFGSLYEDSVDFILGNEAKVRTFIEKDDIKNIEKSIRDARKRSNLTIFSVHTHEGLNENWYDDQPAEFIEEAARRAIDAGADVVVGHGAHFLRGIEIYHDKPIFYNLGSFIMEFEAGESLLPPEMNVAYGYKENELPSVIHGNRAVDKHTGEFSGFNGNPKFSYAASVILTKDSQGKVTFALLPLDLGLTRTDTVKRGIPEPANPEFSKEITKFINHQSKEYGTKFKFNEKNNLIELENS